MIQVQYNLALKTNLKWKLILLSIVVKLLKILISLYRVAKEDICIYRRLGWIYYFFFKRENIR